MSSTHRVASRWLSANMQDKWLMGHTMEQGVAMRPPYTYHGVNYTYALVYMDADNIQVELFPDEAMSAQPLVAHDRSFPDYEDAKKHFNGLLRALRRGYLFHSLRRRLGKGQGRTASGLGLEKIKSGDSLTLKADDVYAHVWFDSDVARTDFGGRVPDSGEWQVIISTSPDKLNLRPRGRELARETFRYADPRMRGGAQRMAEDYIKRSLVRFKGRVSW